METDPTSEFVRAPLLADWLLSRGHVAVTTADAAALLGVPDDQVRVRLRAPARRGEWVSPARGLWVPVPPHYRTWGAPPVLEYLDAWMGHLGARYYVGWLTAAAVHGAAHHAAQVTQVAVDKPVANRQIGRSRVELFVCQRVADLPTVAHQVPTGTVPVTTVEATALDLAANPGRGGGIDNVANIVIDLADDPGVDVDRLAEASRLFPVAALRRVGWLLEHFTEATNLQVLRELSVDGGTTPSSLSPLKPRTGGVDPVWNLYVNKKVEPDL